MRIQLILLSVLIFFNSCSKFNQEIDLPAGRTEETIFKKYNIPKDQHFSSESVYTPVSYTELDFIVKFDSSAIYTTLDRNNQYDINKLYGFSDNDAQHHQFSARIGWRWSDEALRLFGYVYNNGQVSYEELGIIIIGKAYACAIKIRFNAYIFSVEDKTITMPRLSTTEKTVGYKLFPYFGGDETAPHLITIQIKEK